MFNIGDKVRIKDCFNYGIIKNIKNNDVFYIDINGKNVVVKKNMIEKINKNIIENTCNIKKNNTNYNFENSFVPEIMIRHQTLDIAMYNVENFINDAILNNVKNIKIIHGRSGGILRNAVHEYLKHNKNVESYRLGGYTEGNNGVTIVKLK